MDGMDRGMGGMPGGMGGMGGMGGQQPRGGAPSQQAPKARSAFKVLEDGLFPGEAGKNGKIKQPKQKQNLQDKSLSFGVQVAVQVPWSIEPTNSRGLLDVSDVTTTIV